MTSSPRTTLITTTGALILILVGIFFLIISFWLPKMEAARESIRHNEATIAAIQRQQENVSELTKQLADRKAEKEQFDKELWGFSKEDAFFELWDAFGVAHQTTVTLTSVADAAPGPVPIEREAVLTITGSLQNILKTVDALSLLSPAVVLRAATYGPTEETTDSVAAQITIATLWYDDTVR